MEEPRQAKIDLYDSIFLEEHTLTPVPQAVEDRMIAHGNGPLIAVVFRGIIPSRRVQKFATVVGAPPHLGAIAGSIRCAIDRSPEDARAKFMAAYDQWYALERDQPWAQRPG